jgi:hypothetical protein
VILDIDTHLFFPEGSLMSQKWPKGLFAGLLQERSYIHLEQQVRLFPILAIPVMFNHLGANRPFDALRVLIQVGERIGTAKGLPVSMLDFVFEDVLPCARTHERWRDKMRETFEILPHAALELLREKLPGSKNADMFELLPPLTFAERKQLH